MEKGKRVHGTKMWKTILLPEDADKDNRPVFKSWLLKLGCAQKSPLKLLKNAVYSGLSLGQISGVSILASTLRVSDDNPVDQILGNVPIYGFKKG